MESGILEKGRILRGKYRIEEQLGRGGMAVVYRARNIAVDRTVAIKVLHPEFAKSEEIVRRFKREAKAANQARHPNIVDVLDVDQDGPTLFIVQEYLDGEDFAALLKRDPVLPVEEALDILMPVTAAVAAAHAKGVVHRDLKPDNVFLVNDGGVIVPKILDFGISKMPLADFRSTGPGGGPMTMKGGRITVAGMAMGTPYYMSPEQIRDPGGVDPRTDVWAIGVMLYEALTGLMPFDADDMAELFAKIHTMDPRRVDRVVADVTPAIAKVVHRCMRVDVTERYPDGKALSTALAKARMDIDDEPSLEARIPELTLETTKASRTQGVPSERSSSGRGSADALRLALPSDSAPSLPSGDGASAASSGESASGHAPSQQGPASHPGLSLELDLPKPSERAAGAAAPSDAAPSDAGPAIAPQPSFIDDDDSDDDIVGMDLAVQVPTASSRGAASGHRVARSHEQSPESRRRIHLRQHEGPKLTGSYVRFALAAAVVALCAFSASYLTPAGMDAARDTLAGWLLPTVAGAMSFLLIAFVLTAYYGLRLVSYTLFLASLGLFASLGSFVAAAAVWFAPGIAPDQFVSIALFVAPFATMATVVGYALFAGAHGRELRAHDDERFLGNLLWLAALLALGASAWIVQRPRASLATIQAARPAVVDAVERSGREISAELRGGQLAPAKSVTPTRSTHRGSGAIDHVNVSLRSKDTE